VKQQRWLSKKRKAKSSVIYAQESVDGNSKEMLKRVWFSFVGINWVMDSSSQRAIGVWWCRGGVVDVQKGREIAA
jgi:hypothetical protein